MIKFMKSKWTAIIIGLFAVFFGANSVLAASLSNVTVAPDSTQAGVMTNHVINFDTSSTGAISGAGTVTIVYPAGFNLTNTSLGIYGGNLGSNAWYSRNGNTVYINMGSNAIVGNSDRVSFQLVDVINTSTAGSYTVSVTTKNAAGATVDDPTNSASFTIGQTQTLDHFAVSPSTTSTTVGQDVTLTITAQDASNNTVTGYAGTPTLSGLATAPNSQAPYYGTLSFTNGVASAIVRSYSAQSGQSVTVTDSGKTGNSGTIVFAPGALSSITLSPSGNQTITAGATVQFSAQGKDAYGNNRTGDTFTWTGTTAAGLFNSTAIGNYNVYATSGTINSPTVVVTVNPGAVNSMAIDPSGTTQIGPGASRTITVTLRDAYNNLVANGTVVNWSRSNSNFTLSATSSTTTGGVATVTLTAPSTTGVSTTVTATSGGISATSGTISTASSVLTTVSISPAASQTITAGQTIQFVATGYDQYGTVMTGLTFAWTGTTTTGLFNTTVAGIYSVYATSGGINSNIVTVTVNPGALASIVISPSTAQTITAGATIQFSAQAKDAYGNNRTGDTFTWTGTNATGLFNNTVAGSYNVYATSGSINSPTVSVIVNPGTAATISISPSAATTINPGTSTTVTATLRDAYGNLVANGTVVNWTRSNSSFTLSAASSTTTNGIATVTLTAPTSTGVSTTVTVTSGSVSATTAAISTSQSVLTTIKIRPDSNQSITTGESIQFVAYGYDQFGNEMGGFSITWYGTNSLGLFTNSTPGVYLVYAKADGLISNQVQVTVLAKPEPSKEEQRPSQETKKEKPAVKPAAKVITTAKAAEKQEPVEEETEETEEIIEEPEIITEAAPLISAESTEKPTRNWWIPVIIIILVLVAAYYGYVALAGGEKADKANAVAKSESPEKRNEKKEVATKKTTKVEDTKEIKPIEEGKDEKDRW